MLLQQLNMWPHLYIEHTGSYSRLNPEMIRGCVYGCVRFWLVILQFQSSVGCPWQWLGPVMSGMRWKFANNLCHQLLPFCSEGVFVLLLWIWSLIFALSLRGVRFMYILLYSFNACASWLTRLLMRKTNHKWGQGSFCYQELLQGKPFAKGAMFLLL